MKHASMTLKVLLPFGLFLELDGVSRIVADTLSGSIGMLPHRMDCVAALNPGILVYETTGKGEQYIAVDEGIMIKTGFDVVVSVRDAIAGTDLKALEEAVEREFINVDEQEQLARAVLIKMEGAFLIRLAEVGA